MRATASEGRINIILVGGSGDLAKKYLWQSLFELHLQRPEGVSYRFWSADRSPPAVGKKTLADILDTRLQCPAAMPDEACADIRSSFAAACAHATAKTEDDFRALGQEVSDATDGLTEQGRLVYLSVPPSAYGAIAANVNKHCRPAEGAWLRVAFEKPFGHDHESAKVMAAELKESLSEEEIYRVDHYLGKRGVKQISAFKAANKKLFDSYFRTSNVERVDVVVTETDTCENRTRYYDQYGVVRDMHQNHLTEVMSLVAMDVPAPEKGDHEFARLKLAVLQQMQPVTEDDALLAQYGLYQKHIQTDFRGRTAASATATFAAASVKLNCQRWQGVPFVLVAGKDLAERRAYVRITFRSDPNIVCVSGPTCNQHRSMVFNIQGGPLGGPGVTVTGAFPKQIETPDGWTLDGHHEAGVLHFTPSAALGTDAPYNQLVVDMVNGNRGSFVSTDFLMLSWRRWGPLISRLQSIAPRRHKAGGAQLRFKLKPNGAPEWVNPPPSHQRNPHSEL